MPDGYREKTDTLNMIPISSTTNNNNVTHTVGVESVRNTTFNIQPITNAPTTVTVVSSSTNNSEYTIPDYVQRILDEVKQKQNTSSTSGFYNTNSQTTPTVAATTTSTTTTTTTNQLGSTLNNTHLSQVQANTTYVSNSYTPAVTSQAPFETNYFNHDKDFKKTAPTSSNNIDSSYQTSYRFAVDHPQSQNNTYTSQAIYDSYKLTNVINSSLPYQDYGAIRKESTPLMTQFENQFKPQTGSQYNFVPTSTQRDTIDNKEPTHQVNQQDHHSQQLNQNYETEHN